MKNRFLVSLAFFLLVSFGGFVVASEMQSTYLREVVIQRVGGSLTFEMTDLNQDRLSLCKEDCTKLGVKYTGKGQFCKLSFVDSKKSGNKDIDLFIKNHSGYNHFFLPANVVLGEESTPKSLDFQLSKRITLSLNVIVNECNNAKKNDYSIIKPLAEFSLGFLLGLIFFAYKNNVSS